MYNSDEKAILFIIKAFKEKKDKYSSIDRATLSLLVGLSIRKISDDPNIIIASYLHNIINYSSFGYEEIESNFNTNVANIVRDISEDWSLTKWLERKKEYLNRIKDITNVDYLNIIVAEKTQELLSYHDTYDKKKDKLWREIGSTKTEVTWFYRSILTICEEKDVSKILLHRYRQEITYFFGDIL